MQNRLIIMVSSSDWCIRTLNVSTNDVGVHNRLPRIQGYLRKTSNGVRELFS